MPDPGGHEPKPTRSLTHSTADGRKDTIMAIQQVTLSWLKEPDNEDHIRRLTEAAEKLKEIPGVCEVSIHPCARLGRPSQDETFHSALVVRFESAEAARAYGPHPLHVRAAELSQELTTQVRSYSYEL
ncbi:hypothetical protein BN12_1360023 [Nostocoides japonicum T1-X7]|uniref:Stress-response A/B barrel domain-containing protein n=2 Tax=Nostocoides japonicum TaxID=99481 RepID=A0A077LXI5_9MICO|nr:hypothetical protein BN12_1360023 [Tetrasphaera japonica T1-X7]